MSLRPEAQRLLDAESRGDLSIDETSIYQPFEKCLTGCVAGVVTQYKHDDGKWHPDPPDDRSFAHPVQGRVIYCSCPAGQEIARQARGDQ